jgi:hypothetical protein
MSNLSKINSFNTFDGVNELLLCMTEITMSYDANITSVHNAIILKNLLLEDYLRTLPPEHKNNLNCEKITFKDWLYEQMMINIISIMKDQQDNENSNTKKIINAQKRIIYGERVLSSISTNAIDRSILRTETTGNNNDAKQKCAAKPSTLVDEPDDSDVDKHGKGDVVEELLSATRNTEVRMPSDDFNRHVYDVHYGDRNVNDEIHQESKDEDERKESFNELNSDLSRRTTRGDLAIVNEQVLVSNTRTRNNIYNVPYSDVENEYTKTPSRSYSYTKELLNYLIICPTLNVSVATELFNKKFQCKTASCNHIVQKDKQRNNKNSLSQTCACTCNPCDLIIQFKHTYNDVVETEAGKGYRFRVFVKPTMFSETLKHFEERSTTFIYNLDSDKLVTQAVVQHGSIESIETAENTSNTKKRPMEEGTLNNDAKKPSMAFE